MIARFVALAFLLLIPSAAGAQPSTLPGFPPGVFQSRGALDAAAAAGGTVHFDTSFCCTPSSQTSTTALFTSVINIGSGSSGTANRVLVVWFYMSGSAPGVTSGLSLSLDAGTTPISITSGPFAGTSDFFLACLVNPPTGVHNLNASWTGTDNSVRAALISLVDADQTTPCHNITTLQTGTGTTASTGSVTTATGEIVLGAYVNPTNWSSGSNSDVGNQSTGNVASVAANCSGNGTPTATTCAAVAGSSQTLTYTGASSTWFAKGVSIKAH